MYLSVLIYDLYLKSKIENSKRDVAAVLIRVAKRPPAWERGCLMHQYVNSIICLWYNLKNPTSINKNITEFDRLLE